jgi:hypothetical protein
MPEQAVIDFMTNKNVSTNIKLELDQIKDFARKFEVSLIAAAIRLRELGFYVRYV